MFDTTAALTFPFGFERPSSDYYRENLYLSETSFHWNLF